MGGVKRNWGEKLILFIAEGFGSGWSPVAPGTLGTLVGFGWIYLLLLPGNIWFYLAGIIAGFFAAVWIGGAGERICGKHDPGSIVIDEIAAMPLALLGSILALAQGSSVPQFREYLDGKKVLALLVAFAGFRLFDVTKPWIVGRAQTLPGGWGLVLDDFLAALHVIPFGYLVSRLL
jgi:phosphatidylglycerophosphatase A